MKPRQPPAIFDELGLASPLLTALRDKGYSTPTDIQARAIPVVLSGHDVLGCAQTGTGKTAAFALPILHRLRDRTPGSLRVLVLTPTRELAIQVAESFRAYGQRLPFHTATVIGGVEMWSQRANLRRGTDVLVATPGRLLDHIYQCNLDFSHLEVVVLDEADRMLDMGFIDDVKFIMSCLPSRRQTLFFSATLDREIQGLATELLDDPVWVQVSPDHRRTAAGVRHRVCHVAADQKREILRALLDEERMEHVLAFTKTKIGADKLGRYLEHTGIDVGVLHSDRTQMQRLAVLEAFKKGRLRVMVATDVAARGLDISGISHVINVDVPQTPESYVHRVGRTARAGDRGDAITLVAPQERSTFREIERRLDISAAVESVRGMTLDGSGPVAPPEPRPDRGHRGAPAEASRPTSRRAERAPRRPARGSGPGPGSGAANRSRSRDRSRSELQPAWRAEGGPAGVIHGRTRSRFR